MADVLSFAKVLAKVRMTSVSGVRTAQCVAESTAQRARFLRYTVSRQDGAAATFQQLGEDFTVVRSIHRITRQGGTKTRFEPGRSSRVAKHGSDLA
jgi:nicotinamidase-related amidase